MILEDVIDSIKLKCRQLPYRKDLNPYFKCELNHDDNLKLILIKPIEDIIVNETLMKDEFWTDPKNEQWILKEGYIKLSFVLANEVLEHWKAAKS